MKRGSIWSKLTNAAVIAVVAAACEVAGSSWAAPVEFRWSIAWLRKNGTLVLRTLTWSETVKGIFFESIGQYVISRL